jgi:hypothetical protein
MTKTYKLCNVIKQILGKYSLNIIFYEFCYDSHTFSRKKPILIFMIGHTPCRNLLWKNILNFT